MTGRPSVEQVERLLIDHEYSLGLRDRSICRCGYKPPRDPERGWSQQEWHREHIAEAVLALFADEPVSRAEYHYARGLAAGRMEAEPETVSTAEELDALPVGSVVRSKPEDAPRVEHGDGSWSQGAVAELREDAFGEPAWFVVGAMLGFRSHQADLLPATVLHRPTEGDDR